MLFGMDILLKYNNIFQQLLNNGTFDVINCSLDKEQFDYFRSDYGDSFYEGYYHILKLIMVDSRININKDQSYPLLENKHLCEKYNVNITYYINDNLINLCELELPENYITVSTKVLGAMDRYTWENIKSSFFDILKKYKYPIILLGEKDIKPCREYNIHSPYSIYYDLINYLPNYIDYTIKNSGNNNDIEPLKRTLKILNKSQLNIFMSTSGVKTLTLYTSENIIAMSESYDVNCFLHKNKNNIFHAVNIQEFLDKLNNFMLNIC